MERVCCCFVVVLLLLVIVVVVAAAVVVVSSVLLLLLLISMICCVFVVVCLFLLVEQCWHSSAKEARPKITCCLVFSGPGLFARFWPKKDPSLTPPGPKAKT